MTPGRMIARMRDLRLAHAARFRQALFFLLVALLPCLLVGRRLYEAPSEVAFLGDSITEEWAYPKSNLGVFGNTTAQMEARAVAQISDHRYKQVVILGGTNDVLLGIDPATTIHNLGDIARWSVRAGVQPVLCQIPPIFHSPDTSNKTDYSHPVRELNRQIAKLAAEHNWKLIDYYDPILRHPDYSSDGVHMKRRGHIAMEWVFLKEMM